ncbi:MAG: hypothetical protein U0234_06335 [Sandaracinus sp.]
MNRFGLGSLVLLAACSSPTSAADAAPAIDAPAIDAPPTDAPATDAPATDAPAIDAPPTDAPPDAAVDPCAAGACDPCDDALAVDDASATHAAQALGACSGLVAASWVLPDGASVPSGAMFDIGHGILPSFGSHVAPREGARLLALSSGAARTPALVGFQTPAGYDRNYECGAPTGFPFESPNCPGIVTATPHDGTALAFTLDVPAGANGFRIFLKHYSSEWPAFVCSSFDDQAALIVQPAPPGSSNGDVAIDTTGNALSVNLDAIDVCACASPPCIVGGRSFACSRGTLDLEGTGYDALSAGAAATPWLEVRVPATAGNRIELRLAVWDSGDGVLDTTVLADGFRWITDAPAEAEMRVVP